MKTRQREVHIKDSIRGTKGRFKFIKSWKGKIISEGPWIDNVVMKTTGRGVNKIANNMIGVGTAEITHGKISTNNTAPTDADTGMTAVVVENILRGDQSVNSVNIVHLEFFISDADLANGTYKKWGIYTGTYGVDEEPFAIALISPNYTKATNEDTTVVHEIAINN